MEAKRKSRVSRETLDFDTVRVTAWFYAIYCPVYSSLGFWAYDEDPTIASRILGTVFGLACTVAALSTLRLKKLGYRFCWILSILLLPALPIGTVLGVNMLRALRRNRDRFYPPRRIPRVLLGHPV